MDEKLAAIEARFEELTRQMADETLANDYVRYAEIWLRWHAPKWMNCAKILMP